jgi:hypothetical protein
MTGDATSALVRAMHQRKRTPSRVDRGPTPPPPHTPTHAVLLHVETRCSRAAKRGRVEGAACVEVLDDEQHAVDDDPVNRHNHSILNLPITSA